MATGRPGRDLGQTAWRALREEYLAAPLGDSHLAAATLIRARNPTADSSPIAATTIGLGGLDPTEGFLIQGDVAGDRAGWSVSDAGDVNGDGFDDVIVGARTGDDGGANAGEAYVIFGKATGFGTVDLTTLSAADGFIIQGAVDVGYSSTGHSVSAAGDVNGDGFDDVIVGAPHADDGGFPKSGEAYVIYGKATGFGSTDGAGRQVIDLAFLAASDGVIILGEDSYDFAGWSVAGAGDVNGDGFDDIIVGAYGSEDGGANSGAAYVLFGNASGLGAVFDLALFSADDAVGFTIDGGAQDRAGLSVAAAGDVNGDGFGDLIVGAPSDEQGGTPGAGATYVIFGKANGFTDINLGSLALADGFAILGEGGFDNSGTHVSGAGDINGDGYDEIIIASPETTNPVNNGHSAFVIFGKASGFATIDLETLSVSDGFVISYEIGATGTNISSVAPAGDVDGDGFADFIVGLVGRQEAWVIFGHGNSYGEIELKTLVPADGFVISGDGSQHEAGFSVSGAGDVNQDGYDDLIVGAHGGDLGGSNAGEAYVIFGGPSGITVQGSAGADNLVGGEGKDTLEGRGGDDTLQGNAGGDFLKGSAGRDWADYGSAPDGLTVNLKRPENNEGHARGDSYQSIENVFGSPGADRITGNNADNIIEGGNGRDVLAGGRGDDTLRGGAGKDKLKGGADADQFVLSSSSPADSETILDFTDADRIALDGSVYGLPAGPLAQGRFVVGTAAVQPNDRFIYDDASGRLYFDPDGSGAAAQSLIATLTGAPSLAAADFIVI